MPHPPSAVCVEFARGCKESKMRGRRWRKGAWIRCEGRRLRGSLTEIVKEEEMIKRMKKRKKGGRARVREGGVQQSHWKRRRWKKGKRKQLGEKNKCAMPLRMWISIRWCSTARYRL